MAKSSDIFSQYAPFYDLIYQDKDYAAEASFVSSLIKKFYPKNKGLKVLDLACGTGRHALELAGMGYAVEGSDISADMIKVARQRAKSQKVPIRFYNESFQTSNRIDQKYDVIIAMFSAIDYLTKYEDLQLTLANIRGLLKKDGIFIFDCWNGNAVLKSYSPVRVKRAHKGKLGVIRLTNTTLDQIKQIATLNFEFTFLEEGKIIREFKEVHPIRYFFPQEMIDLLKANGFKVIHRCPFLNKDSSIGADDWNLTYVTGSSV